MLRSAVKQKHASPLGQGRSRPAALHSAPLLTLAAGFVPAALASFAAARFVGMATGVEDIPRVVRCCLAGLAFVVAIVVDIRAVFRGAHCSAGLSRQTRKAYLDAHGLLLGPFMWGLDTGLAFTTVRVSAATWGLFVAAILTLTPSWCGIAYGLAFSASVYLVTVIPAWRSQSPDPEPMWLLHQLMHLRRLMQEFCIAVLLVAVTVCCVAAAGTL